MWMLVPSTETLIIGKSLTAFAIASIIIGVKVMFCPSLFLKSAFTEFLQFTIFVISASTKEVICAEVCFDIVI